ncbi:MAG: hypothetical protein ACREOO_11810 [bacterium]
MDQKKDWDVSAPHGPTRQFEFATDEGTWMNLDVSPEGKEVVFDLLGDIYIMPITGGEARLLSGGPAFEVQPRFSPDGKRISFTSDRAGGDNIWFMKRDGSEPKQVSKEDFRLLNNAVWTPDGNYLIGRKHFTSTRSLGAGEMWLYHVSGDEGLQLTKRKNDQQDAGEPCVSPGGRYVYFSEDVSPGGSFQYNKDPNGQIYVIRRLDRETGQTMDFIIGPGGAVRPQCSPDGRYLSFVRRVRLKSVLYLHDLATGEDWPLFDKLNKDQQETWATFGVYPNYAWTPDSKNIVIWAQGKIWNLAVASKQAAPIPFTAKVKQTLTAALHSPQTAFVDSFEIRMIRDAATSPDQKWLAFSAVGSLWKKPLPNGRPQRLTNSSDFECFPSFSPDGQWLVYSTWNDTALGALYKIRLDGRQPTKLTKRKGYYLTPSFSRNGQNIVYRRDDGNSMLGFAFGVEPGLYWISAGGGEEHFVQEEGYTPRFNRKGDRIFFLAGNGLEKKYQSVRLEGGDIHTHFNLKYVNQIALSPDEEWVAFTELYQAYITPFPKTGGSFDLNNGSKAIPVKRVTRDAGDYLHWSGDSKRLHWTIGPEYFTQELHNSFKFVTGAADSIAGPDSSGLKIGLKLASDIPAGKLALVGARILTMRGEEVIENGAILLEGNRITALGKAGALSIPAEAKRIDVSGKTIMPGLIDVHAHANHFFTGLMSRQNWAYFANLAYGVTTMHDPSATTETVFTLAEMVSAGKMAGPRVSWTCWSCRKAAPFLIIT